jgi:hypothetical protein
VGNNKLFAEEFRRVGAYKVKGNSYLLKGNNVTDVYTPEGFAVNLPLIYDTYDQQLSILQDEESVMRLNFKEVDSFFVKVDNDSFFKTPTWFINASIIDASKKFYVQRMVSGGKYELFKYIMDELRPAAADVAQSNIKEFEMVSEFYYRDMNNKDELIKIKKNLKPLKEMFRSNKEIMDTLSANDSISLEDKLILVFTLANN